MTSEMLNRLPAVVEDAYVRLDENGYPILTCGLCNKPIDEDIHNDGLGLTLETLARLAADHRCTVKPSAEELARRVATVDVDNMAMDMARLRRNDELYGRPW
jgi:hypothetical protein